MSRTNNTYFVPGAGIDREVITTDICRYLGPDATVKPGSYKDPNPRRDGTEAREEKGFFVTAYRSLTSSQMADLKADSAKWFNERAKSAHPRNGGDGYSRSATRASQAQPPYNSNAVPYGGSPQPQGMSQPPYDNYGRQLPQPLGYGGSQDFNPNQGPYTFGEPVRFETANGRGMQQNAPRASYPPTTSGPYAQGRGMDMGYQQNTGYLPPNNMASPPYYDQSPGPGRTQPMAVPQNYATTNQSYNDPYSSYRGLGQQDDTPMDDFTYEDQYQDPTASFSSMAPQPQLQMQRDREREHTSKHRDREHERNREERDRESRHKEKRRQ